MGFRNPFRMSVDKPTGIVYLGDYGPDAGVTDANRGPGGQVEFNRITGARQLRLAVLHRHATPPPRPTTSTLPDRTVAGPSTTAPAAPTNNSFRNTGQATLPAAKPSWIRTAATPARRRSSAAARESPMGGPVYRYNAALNSSVKFPQSLDGRYFAGEYGRRWIKAIAVNANGTLRRDLRLPVDRHPGHGHGVRPGRRALRARLRHRLATTRRSTAIEYIGGGNRSPIAVASANRTSGAGPLTVNFSSAGSSDPEGGALTYLWTFGDGTTSTAANPTKTYTANGTYTPTLRVTDPTGLSGTASLVVTVGNTAPTVTLTAPADGQLFNFGDTVPFRSASPIPRTARSTAPG